MTEKVRLKFEAQNLLPVLNT